MEKYRGVPGGIPGWIGAGESAVGTGPVSYSGGVVVVVPCCQVVWVLSGLQASPGLARVVMEGRVVPGGTLPVWFISPWVQGALVFWFSCVCCL